MKEIEDRHFSRVGLMSYFYEIAVEEFESLIKRQAGIESLKKQGEEEYELEHNGHIFPSKRFIEGDKIDYLERQNSKAVIKIIIFLSTFLESYIWNLSAMTLGQGYTKDYLDKLDMIAKWKIIPKLITTKDLELESRTVEELRRLVKLRNGLIHHKMKDFNPSDHESSMFDEAPNVAPFFTMIDDIFNKLDEIDRPGNHRFQLRIYGLSGYGLPET
jgi:hypothetical protein